MGANTASFKTDVTGAVAMRAVDWVAPERVYRAMAGRPGFLWLDSASGMDGLGRWSYMMWAPRQVISGHKGAYSHSISNGARRKISDPFQAVGQILAQSPRRPMDGAPPFTGGVAGFFGYGLLSITEPSTRLRPKPTAAEGDVWIGVYDCVAAFDHQRNELILAANPGAADQEKALDQMEEMIARAQSGVHHPPTARPTGHNTAVASNFTRQEYMQAVEKTRRYIERGDIYQANIAQRFSAEDRFGHELYPRLRAINPAPFGAYLNTGAARILSASPERFIQLKGSHAQTRPIKGTRPRGRTAQEDNFLKLELINSEKDQAENVMIVDLLRNDFSKVCLPHSVQAPRLCALEAHPTVFHLVSTVTGQLRPGVAPVELLVNTFPGGSITGAPKIRAMEIIDELEPDPRGAYCGAMGYIGYNGDMDMNIIIRTMVAAGGKVHFHAGGGITWLSDPAEEYQETMDKAQALIKAVSG